MIPKPTVSGTPTKPVNADPTAAYRKQQGLAPITQSYDPKLVSWIVTAAKATGADPRILLATAIQESGARFGAVGDGGTSYGPFQFHRGGALGNHDAAWANSYEAVLNRAQEFARNQVHAGPGAAAVQRPQDRALYATGVNSHISQAASILSKYGISGAMPATTSQTAPKTSLANPGGITQPSISNPLEGVSGGEDPVASLLSMAMRGSDPGKSSDPNGILSLLAQPDDAPAPTVGVTPVQPGAAAAPALPPGEYGKATAFANPKIIGGPAAHRARPMGNWQSDNAADIAMPKGTPVYATEDGLIGNRIGSLNSSNPLLQGLRVNLEGADNSFYYAHLSKIAVKAGQRVKKGQLIGYSGIANGTPHLHLGVEHGDPTKYA